MCLTTAEWSLRSFICSMLWRLMILIGGSLEVGQRTDPNTFATHSLETATHFSSGERATERMGNVDRTIYWVIVLGL